MPAGSPEVAARSPGSQVVRHRRAGEWRKQHGLVVARRRELFASLVAEISRRLRERDQMLVTNAATLIVRTEELHVPRQRRCGRRPAHQAVARGGARQGEDAGRRPLARRAVTASCQICGEPFEARRRWARFCSSACRVRAHRARPPVTHSAPRGRAARSPDPAKGTSAARRRSGGSNPAPAVVTHRPVGILPDAVHRGMWRVVFADGRLSEMVNRARAADALSSRRERSAP